MSTVCYIVAGISLLIGSAMLIFGVAQTAQGHFAADEISFMTTSVALIVSSIFWFVVAKVLDLLAQIERNTRK